MFEINDDATGICCKACLSGEWPVDPSMGTPASSYDGTDGSPVQLVLALPAAGAASADEVLDFTSEEEDDPSLGTTAYSYDESPVRIVLALPADEGANANEDHDFFSDCTSEENYDPSWVCTPEEEYDPSWGTSASSYDGSPGVQIVQALRAAGAADPDEFPDCTSEEKDYEGNATPTPFASPEITENPSLGAEPLNLLSLIDENYFCPEVSNRPLQMNFGQKEVLMDTLDGKVVMERKKIDTCAPSK